MGTNTGRAKPRGRARTAPTGLTWKGKKIISEVLEVFIALGSASRGDNPRSSPHRGPPACSVPAVGHGGKRRGRKNECGFWRLLSDTQHVGLSQNGFHWTRYLWGLPEVTHLSLTFGKSLLSYVLLSHTVPGWLFHHQRSFPPLTN